MDRVRGKLQAAKSQSYEATKGKDTNSPTPKGEDPAKYASTLNELSKKFNPGYEKFIKIKELERQLMAKR